MLQLNTKYFVYTFSMLWPQFPAEDLVKKINESHSAEHASFYWLNRQEAELYFSLSRFTADVRSVLSRNLHQHRLWWLVEWRGTGLVEQPLPLCRLPSCPPFPRRRPTSPLWASQIRRVLRRWGLGWAPNMGRTVWDHQSPETTGTAGGASFFFSSWFFICIIFFFSKTKRSLSAL